MTSDANRDGASLNPAQKWKSIKWTTIEREVKRLQMRIAKAAKAGKWNRVKVLQRILTRSYSAKLLAVKRVSTNKGARTPGIDRVLWRSNTAKMKAVLTLKTKGYKAQPLRRTKMRKKNGKWRFLGIPTMHDRAMQALYLSALEPISETTADGNSYGFRPYRACRDAMAQTLVILSGKHSAQWILEADIKACFDGINHDWLLDNIPLEKPILRQWLKCGYMEKNRLFPTQAGTPQGGIISPVLANMTLDGLEARLKDIKRNHKRSKINFVRYADDFIVTASSKTLLEEQVMQTLQTFLQERGLQLSAEKTQITHIRDGFDFLSTNVRKFGSDFQMKPSKAAGKSLYAKVRELVKASVSWKTEDLIRKLNPILRGWANYHRYGSAYNSFKYLDWKIFNLLLRVWLKRRHPTKSMKWKRKRYFRQDHDRSWIFHARTKDKDGKTKFLDLVRLSDIKRLKCIKIRGKANPYDPDDIEYFEMRKKASNVMPLTNNKPLTLKSLTAGFI